MRSNLHVGCLLVRGRGEINGLSEGSLARAGYLLTVTCEGKAGGKKAFRATKEEVRDLPWHPKKEERRIKEGKRVGTWG